MSKLHINTFFKQIICWMVLVKYYGKMSIKTFVGQILSAESGLLTEKCLVKFNLGKLSENDDVDEIDIEQIILKLDEPVFDNRGHAYHF